MRRVRAARESPDGGAAAVEFALLLPIFLAIVLGIITIGLAFERWIGITQAAREGSRVGATLSLAASNDPPPGDINTWLQKVYDSSLRASGLATTDPGFAACVALFDGTTFTKRNQSGQSTGECYADGQSGPRVQVVLQRDTFWDWFFVQQNVTIRSRSTTRWEATT